VLRGRSNYKMYGVILSEMISLPSVNIMFVNKKKIINLLVQPWALDRIKCIFSHTK